MDTTVIVLRDCNKYFFVDIDEEETKENLVWTYYRSM